MEVNPEDMVRFAMEEPQVCFNQNFNIFLQHETYQIKFGKNLCPLFFQ